MHHEHSPESTNQPSLRHQDESMHTVSQSHHLPSIDSDLKVFSELTRLVLRKHWNLAADLASEQCHTNPHPDQVPSQQEVTYLCLFAIVNGAPERVSSSLEELLPVAQPLDKSPVLPLDLQQIMLEPFVGKIRAGTWKTFQQTLSFLEHNKENIPNDTLIDLLNVRVNRRQLNFAPFAYEVTEENRSSIRKMPSLLHVVYLANRATDHWGVTRLVKLGADPAAKFDHAHPARKEAIRGCTLAHAIMMNADITTLGRIHPNKELLTIPNTNGDLPAHSLISNINISTQKSARKKSTQKARQLLKDVLALHPENEILTTSGNNLASYLLEQGKFHAYVELKDLLPLPSIVDTDTDYPVLPYEASRRFTALELLESTTKILARQPESLQQEAGTLLAHGQNLYDLYLYTEAAIAVTTTLCSQGEGLLRLMPRLLWHYPREQAKELMAAYEKFHDDIVYEQNRFPSHHASEAEVMLLLNHPDFESLQSANTNFLTAAITSVSRFIERSLPLTNITALENWRRVGAITHSFNRYKFDAKPIASASLLSSSLINNEI